MGTDKLLYIFIVWIGESKQIKVEILAHSLIAAEIKVTDMYPTCAAYYQGWAFLN